MWTESIPAYALIAGALAASGGGLKLVHNMFHDWTVRSLFPFSLRRLHLASVKLPSYFHEATDLPAVQPLLMSPASGVNAVKWDPAIRSITYLAPIGTMVWFRGL
jgi:hypothetical protein